MADETPVVVESTEAPAADAAPKPPDEKALLNEQLKKANVRLKAKDREYVPRDIDDLTQRANRSFGLEAEIESFKKEKGEAAQVKSWRAAIEADDEDAAEQAFESLSPRAQQNAAKWLQKKANAWEESQKLPPEALRERQLREQSERELQTYRQRETEAKRHAETQENVKSIRSAQEEVLKVATEVLGLFKSDPEKSPRARLALQPFAARHMRAAMAAEAETGVAVDQSEIARNVQTDVAQAFGSVSEGMGDADLYEAMGEATVKRLLKEHLMRVKGIKPKVAAAPVKTNGASGPQRGTPAFLR